MKTNKELIKISDDLVMNKIYYIRNHKVMLDTDLAELYKVETKQLKRQVKRNIERFPEDFMFELTQQEVGNLRSQIGTSSWGGSRYLPIVFTEQGIAMLSSVLNSQPAIAVNIQIIRVFTKIRQMLLDNTELRLAIEEIRKKTDNNSKNIEVVFKYLDELLEKREDQKPRKSIGYKLPVKKQ
jgi:hypothetical protein